MNMQQPDPGGLFEQFKGQAQSAPVNKSVTSQLASRPVPDQSLPPVTPPSPALVAAPVSQPVDPVSQLVALSQSGEIKKLRALKEAQAQAADPVNQLVSMSQDGTLASMRLNWEDQQYQQQLDAWEQRENSPFRTMGFGGIAGGLSQPMPEPPIRKPEQIASDWQKGIHHLRGSELGSILNQLETGRLTPEQEAQITQHIEPQLPPEIRTQLQTARLTRDDLEKLNAAAMAEEEQAKIFEKESLFMNPYQIAGDERFGQHTQSGNVFGRGVAKGLTMNYAFAPDEERLNSDDPAVVADERAKRLFYQQQEAKYPVSSLAGNILGAVPLFAVGGAALRGARVAKANLGLMAPTELTASAIARNNAIIASKGAATTTGGRVAMGAGEGLVYDLASRPEGSENMSLAENLQARATQAGFGVALGSMMELGLLKAGDAWQLAKDKRFESQLKKEAKAQGYGSDVDRYLADLLTIERTDDGRLLARARRESVTDLPDLESTHELSRAEQDKADVITFDTSDLGGSTEPVPPTSGTTPVDDATTVPPADLTGTQTTDITAGSESVTRPGTGETAPIVSGGEQSAVDSAATSSTTSGTGKTTERVSTKKGTKFDVEFELVDADDLSTSHLGNGVVNPDYPEALQPRDRTKMTSEAQVREIANTLEPEWLGSSPKASDGAPIIGDDGLVESGNGRILALRLAYAQGDQGRSGLYRQWLKDNAEKFGIDPAAVDGMNKPVLVRKRTTPMSDEERIRYTKEANDRDQASFSPTEQARIDASRLTDDDIIMFAPGENGNIAAESNLNFLHRFIKSVGLEDVAGLFDNNNRPNQVLVQRVQAAIFKKAYDDDRLLSLMSESTEADMRGEVARNMVAALTKAAPTFARARAMGNLPPESDFIPNLLEAVDLVRQSRRENQSLSEIISQGSLLDQVDPITEELATFLDANLRSSQRMGEVLKDLGQQLENEAARGGADLFGSAPASKADFISATNRNMEARGERAPFTRNEPTSQARAGSEATEVPSATETSRTEGQSTGAGRTTAGDAGSGKTAEQVDENGSRSSLKSGGESGGNSRAVQEEHAEEKTVTSKSGTVYKDTRGTGTIFHGSSSEITLNNYHYADQNIYGQGFYTSDAIDIVEGYSRKGKGGSPTFYKVTLRGNVPLYDMEAPLTPEIEEMLREVFGDYYPDTLMDTGLPPQNMREVFNEFRAESSGNYLSTHDVQEYFDGVRANLEEQGYRGFNHVGGHGTGNLPHDVKIYWHPETDVHIEKFDPKIYHHKDGSISVDGQKIPKGGSYVPNTHKASSAEMAAFAGTPHAAPFISAARLMAKSLNLGESAFSAFGGGVYGATNSDEEIGSDQWWLDVIKGAGLATFGMGASRYLGIHGKDSFLANFSKYLGQQWEKLPGLGRGSPEIRRLKKQQQLMRQIINRQTGQMGEFLAKNFTPAERSEMADIIENRGYPKQANLVARQAQELDDFITYTADRMKALGMLPPDLETGGYLHRYYAKHLKVGMEKGIEGIFKQTKKTLSGSYTIPRGTNETFQPEYLSDAVKQQMAEYDRIKNRIDELEGTKDDLLFSQTSDELDDLKVELKALQDIQLKEYVGIQNDKPHSFIFMPDEVPTVPGLQPFAGSNTPPLQPEESDRIWSLRGTVGDQPVLWRDWTKTEREKWGEITDAGYRFVRGQAEVAHDLSMATMFHQISQRPDWVSNKPMTLNGEDWVEVSRSKIPKSQMYKYGALAGKYVKPDVWRAIQHYNQPLFGRGRAATIYRNMLDKWKLYKTVYNPVSHFNNTVSNLQMYYMAGYSARHLGSSINELRKGENSQYWREARDVGLFGSDWSSSLLEGGEQSSNLAELAEVLRNQPDIADANQVNDSLSMINRFKTWLIESKESVNSADTKLGSGAAVAKAIASPVVGVMNKPIKAATDSAKWLYQKEDELFKLAVFIEERKKGLKPFDAMEAANRFFFDYNDLPDAVRKVKDFPIGSPFISYTYLALPAIIRNAIERPERMLALAAAFEGLNYASLALDGQLEEQGYWDRMDAENTMNPPWMKGRTMWGAPNTIDVSGFKPGLDSYKISLANAHAMGNPFAGESGKDLPLWPGFMAFWGPDPIGGNPVTRIPYDILFNVDWKGDKLYGENDKFEKSMKYAYQAIFPSMPLFPGSWHQKKVIEGMAGDINKAREEGQPVNPLAEGIVTAANSVSEALGGEQFTGADWRGNQFKTTDAVAGSVGAKLRQYKPKDLYVMQANKINSEINEQKMSFNRKRKGDYTKAQMEKYKAEHREELKRLGEEKKKLKAAYDSIKT